MQTSDSTRLILMFNTFGPTMAHKSSQNQVFPSWLIPLISSTKLSSPLRDKYYPTDLNVSTTSRHPLALVSSSCIIHGQSQR